MQMKISMSASVIVLLFGLLTLATTKVSLGQGSANYSTCCTETERRALLMFKQDLKDPSGKLSSWAGDDCCTWQGVLCSDANSISLFLSYNDFEWDNGIPKSLGNLCNLRSLELSDVRLRQDISDILEILSWCAADGLARLDLSRNQVFGHLTDQLGRFKNLDALELYNNSISGLIPASLGEISSLRVLTLKHNKLNGTLPTFLGQLTNLEFLDVRNNLLEGIVSEIHFANLSKLMFFFGSSNPLVLKVGPNWVPPFQLVELRLSSWRLGPRFPQWLGSQMSLIVVDMSYSGISDTVPDWFWNSFQLQYLNLSHNQIYGQLSDKLNAVKKAVVIDLSSNQFKGELPPLHNHLLGLDLSNNSLSGSIFPFLCDISIYVANQLKVLKLGENYFSGEIPDCWMKWPSLISLRLDNNNFTGHVPSSIGTLSFLQSFHLRNNHLSGELPLSLENCKQLVTLDFSENEFVGSIPTFIGKRLSNLTILNLRSNKFHGHIPEELCDLISLQILDLAGNDLFGSIPKCIGNFSAMAAMNSSFNYINNIISQLQFYEDALLVMKGRIVGYSTILKLVRSIDLSQNTLSGDIPKEVTSLHNLYSLNLSHNLLTGRIPENISDMQFVESLDLSANKLSGEIPQSMSSMTFLSHLNLSDNNLTGKIPSSTQLQGFSSSSFIGNPELCGAPLMKNCTEVKSQETTPTDKNEDEFDTQQFYIAMAVGFIVCFWGVCSSLLVKRTWRHAYFQFVDGMRDRIYVAIVLKANWFREKLRMSQIVGA